MKRIALSLAIAALASTAGAFETEGQAKPAPKPAASASPAPVAAAPAAGSYVAPGGVKPPVGSTSNNAIGATQSDTRVSADQLSIKGADFDVLITAAIDAGDVKRVRELLDSGVKVAFDASEKGCMVNPVGFFPTNCNKLFISKALDSKLLSPWLRTPLLYTRSSGGQLQGAEDPAKVKDALDKDRAARQIIADLVANTPAVDKAYFPFYARSALANGDYDLCWWFYQEWKKALPEIEKAPESALPYRVALVNKEAKAYGARAATWPQRWGFAAYTGAMWQDDAHPAALLLLQLALSPARPTASRIYLGADGPLTLAELNGQDDLMTLYAPYGSNFISDLPAQLRLFRRLLAEKPNFDFQDTLGRTPLHYLVMPRAGGDQRRAAPFIRALLEAGANPNLLNKAGETPMAMAVKRQGSGSGPGKDDFSGSLKAFTEKSFDLDLPERTGNGMTKPQKAVFIKGAGL